MYHQFKAQNSQQFHTMMRKLNQTIKHYECRESQMLQYGKIKKGFWYDEQKFTKICIDRTIYNPKHDCYIFVLSNEIVLRYDEREEIFEQVLDKGQEILNIKFLNVGESELYFVLTVDGVQLWNLGHKREKNIKQGKEQSKEDKVKMRMNIEESKQADKIQEQAQEIIQFQQKVPQSFKLNIIHPQVQSLSFIDLIKQINQSKQEKQTINNSQLKPCLRFAGAFIIKDSGINMTQNGQDKQKEEEVLIVTTFWLATERNHRIAVLKLRKIKKASQLNEAEEQNYTLIPIKFPNNSNSIQLTLCKTEVPFDQEKQSQTMNPIQISEANAKLTKSNFIMSCDIHFVKSTSEVKCFSFYSITQAITDGMEQNEYRSFVFEYRIGVTENDKLEQKETWRSPVFIYPERMVMCPAKVYYLPVRNEVGIERSIDIAKTFSFRKENKKQSCQNELPLPSSYKFTTISVIQEGKIKFQQVECRSLYQSMEDEQSNTLTNQSEFRNILNEKNTTWHLVLNEKIALKKDLLLDPIKKYAILLINEKAIKIRPELVQIKGQTKLKKPTRQTKIVVVNLKQNLPASISRISAEYSLQDTVGDSSPNVHLKVAEEIFERNLGSGETLAINTCPSVLENSLDLEKTLSIINVRRHEENKQQKNEEKISLYSEIKMIPKLELYCQLLEGLVGENSQGLESFFGNVIDVLGG